MQLMQNISMAFIFFGSALCVLMALEQVTGKETGRLNILAFVLLLCNGFIMLGVGLSVDLVQVEYPQTGFLFFTALFTLGPLNLFYYHSLLDTGQPLSYKTKLHIIPAVIIFTLEFIFGLQPMELKQHLIAGMFNDPLHSPLSILVAIGWLHVISYLSFLLTLELGLWNSRDLHSEVRALLFINLLAISSASILGIGFVFKIVPLTLAGGVLLTLIHIFMFLARHRYPHFFQILKKEIRQKRYEKSLLSGLNTDLINVRLNELMKEERLYQDMELDLAGLAVLLSITPHQLSQFLNEKLNIDFRNYINSYRIEDAKELLFKEPDKSILTICFEVGFNSKSTFNTVFKKHTGMTPREFRLKNGK